MMCKSDTYEYRLTYIDGDKERTHIFSAFVNGNEMKNNLRNFLLACEWRPETVDKILGELEDE